MTASGNRLVLIASVLLAVVVSSGLTYLLVRRPAPGAVAALPAPVAPVAAPSACARLAACCRTIASRSPGPAKTDKCDTYLALPEVGCVQPLQAYRQTAISLGTTCD